MLNDEEDGDVGVAEEGEAERKEQGRKDRTAPARRASGVLNLVPLAWFGYAGFVTARLLGAGCECGRPGLLGAASGLCLLSAWVLLPFCMMDLGVPMEFLRRRTAMLLPFCFLEVWFVVCFSVSAAAFTQLRSCSCCPSTWAEVSAWLFAASCLSLVGSAVSRSFETVIMARGTIESLKKHFAGSQ